MITKLIYAILLTLLPVTELRVGLPLAVSYAMQNNVPVFLVFILIVLLNVLLIFFIFYFLDNLHNVFMKMKIYQRFFNFYLERFQKRVDKFEKKRNILGIFALTLFVAIPLPGTGAWTGSLLSWLLDLDRKKSIFAIALGVLISGIIILLFSLSLSNIF